MHYISSRRFDKLFGHFHTIGWSSQIFRVPARKDSESVVKNIRMWPGFYMLSAPFPVSTSAKILNSCATKQFYAVQYILHVLLLKLFSMWSCRDLPGGQIAMI